MVAFNTIPGNILVPFWYAEINSGGTPYQGQSRLLLAGQKLAAGTATAGTPIGPIQSKREAESLFGPGSMLAHMYVAARKAAALQPIWVLPLADPAGAKAAGTVTIGSAPGETGVGVLHVLGRRLTSQILSSDAVADVAEAIATAINAEGLPVVATFAAGVVTVTARHYGTLFNGLDLWLANDEPNVLTASNTTIVAMSGGTGVPDLAAAFANLGDDEFDWIAGPYADSTSLNAARDLLSSVTGRWSPMVQLYGHYITTFFGTLSAAVTLGDARNDPHTSIMASQVSPSPQWEWAAVLGAVISAHLTDAPELSRPLQTLLLPGILPPRDRAVWWDKADRQALYTDGMSGYTVTIDGQVAIDRVRTTYQVTSSGVADGTFGDIETMAQGVFAVRWFRTEVSNTHARQALADDNPHNVAEITTPKDIRNTLIHAYQGLVELGVAEKPELFAEYVVVERDGNDAGRVNASIPMDVVNQLRVFAANITINLQYEG
ncbi:phage tail sheath subtilisin-like domain-containing protein [Xanthobacter sp. 91]|uniref:phage tail sheath subtilisin-like domain-containing protein n=1 Tax=Xanthobacter sp. 91 TaxID=1117244 RepID=UPI00068BA352|nr:phage tail sheath subtilisin-like domain-containing protein [Xanthobacter sp. 91]